MSSRMWQEAESMEAWSLRIRQEDGSLDGVWAEPEAEHPIADIQISGIRYQISEKELKNPKN